MSIALDGVLQVTVALDGVIDTFIEDAAPSLDFSEATNSFYLGTI